MAANQTVFFFIHRRSIFIVFGIVKQWAEYKRWQ